MFIARQPIFDRTLKVYGYELLFRSNEQSSSYDSTSSERATATVLGGLFELGLAQIVGNKKSFINFDYNFLLSDSIELIDPSTLVIEILENTKIDDVLIHRVTDLKKKGYKIALDDFDDNIKTYPIVPFADIIKYDLMLTPLNEIEEDVKYALSQKKILLAEKIEYESDFIKAKKMGFHLFQGYFFSKPKIVGGLRARKTANVVYQRIINELHEEEPSYKKLAEIIETDVNLAYRVLKAISRRKKENNNTTIKRALTFMGLLEIERWVNVLMLQELSDKKPSELIKLSLVRSKFGELIATNSIFVNRRHEISLMCLFSVLDAMLDQTMETSLEGIVISDDVRKALIHHEGPLRQMYEIIYYYETGNWKKINLLAKKIEIEQDKLFHWYVKAINWANMTLEYIK